MAKRRNAERDGRKRALEAPPGRGIAIGMIGGSALWLLLFLGVRYVLSAF